MQPGILKRECGGSQGHLRSHWASYKKGCWDVLGTACLVPLTFRQSKSASIGSPTLIVRFLDQRLAGTPIPRYAVLLRAVSSTLTPVACTTTAQRLSTLLKEVTKLCSSSEISLQSFTFTIFVRSRTDGEEPHIPVRSAWPASNSASSRSLKLADKEVCCRQGTPRLNSSDGRRFYDDIIWNSTFGTVNGQKKIRSGPT